MTHRWTAPALVVTIVVSALTIFAPTANAGPNDASNHLASCAQSASTLSALFVLDRSGSLTGTDPQGIRYEALTIALQQLARMDSGNSHKLAVEAAVAAFDDRYFQARSVVRWTRLDPAAFGGDTSEQNKTIDQVVDMARQETTPNGGTDFEAALTGAVSDMADRAAPGTCRVVFWFTDGKFEAAKDTVDAARDRMCRASGLLDKIRKSGIVLVGIQLKNTAIDLQPMSEGTSPDHDCGTYPIPSDWAPGLYIEATDTAALKRIFGSVTDIVQGCAPADASAKLIDPGIRRFRATIQTPSLIRSLRLDSPDGTAISVPRNGSTTAAGYKVTSKSDDDYVSFDVTLPAGHSSGRWMFTTDPATTAKNVSLCVFHGLHFELSDPKQQISAGSTTQIAVNAVGPDGVVTDPAIFKSAAVGATAVGSDGAIRTTSATVKNGQIVVEMSSRPTDARIDLSLAMDVTTKSGLALAPIAGRFPIVLALAKEFPIVTPSNVLDLGTAVRTKPTSADLLLTGSPVGATKVCFGAFESVVVPRETTGTKPTISNKCVHLKVGQSAHVTVKVVPSAAAEGTGSAQLPVMLNSAASSGRPSQEVKYAVPVQWRFSDPLNAPIAIAVSVLIGLLALLLPLFAMGLANFTSAKFETKNLQAGQVDIFVRDGKPRRQTPIEDSPGQLIDVFHDRAPVRPPRSKRFTLFGIDFRARANLNPFGAPTFIALPPPNSRIMSSVGIPLPGDLGAPVNPGLGFVALVVAANADLASQSDDVPAKLVFLLRDSSSFSSDALLADRLANSSLSWDKVSEDWRPASTERVTDSNGTHAARGPADSRRPTPVNDDPFFT